MSGSIAPIILLLTFVVLMILKVPISWSLITSSLLSLVFYKDIPFMVIVQRLFTGADTFSLLAVPFFILAGEIMSAGGLSRRLVDFANSLVGFLPGGLSLVSIAACTFFAAISGSSVATTAAIGGLMVPEMVKHGYPKDFSAAVQAVGGTLGIVIPPSVVFVMYGAATNTSIADLLMSGMIPGLLTGVGLCIGALIISKKNNYPITHEFSFREVFRTFKEAILALIMPLIILGGIYSGIFTPTESAAIAVAYGFIVCIFVYKEISIKNIKGILMSSAKSTAVLMFLVASAYMFGWLITIYNIPLTFTNIIMSFAATKTQFLLFTVSLLLILGMFLEDGATVLILGPIMAPMAALYGVDPIHFGFVMVFTLAIGQATPPFGTTLFVACGISDESVVAVAKKALPFIFIEVVFAYLFALVPIFSTWLPYLMK